MRWCACCQLDGCPAKLALDNQQASRRRRKSASVRKQFEMVPCQRKRLQHTALFSRCSSEWWSEHGRQGAESPKIKCLSTVDPLTDSYCLLCGIWHRKDPCPLPHTHTHTHALAPMEPALESRVRGALKWFQHQSILLFETNRTSQTSAAHKDKHVIFIQPLTICRFIYDYKMLIFVYDLFTSTVFMRVSLSYAELDRVAVWLCAIRDVMCFYREKYLKLENTFAFAEMAFLVLAHCHSHAGSPEHTCAHAPHILLRLY